MTKKQKKFYREEIASIPHFEMSPKELDEIMDIVSDVYVQGWNDRARDKGEVDV